MLTSLMGLLLLSGAADLTTDSTEDQLIGGAIESLRPSIVEPGAASFRRTYFRVTHGMQDDPRAAPGWTVFAAAVLDGRVTVLLGNSGLANAAAFCTPGSDDRWDYDRDLSARFQAELSRR
jgi:hypothetical protein